MTSAPTKSVAHKEERLQSLARHAGEMLIKAMDAGNRNRAYHFMNRMYRLIAVRATLGEKNDA